MAYLNWTPKYSVKVRCFDEDHQHLFNIINQLYEAMKSGRGKDVLQPVLTELLQYTEEHFAREETAMRSRAYPQLSAHVQQHRSFTSQVTQFVTRYKQGATGLSVEMLDFLTGWLSKHIVATDQQYSDFLNARGVV